MLPLVAAKTTTWRVSWSSYFEKTTWGLRSLMFPPCWRNIYRALTSRSGWSSRLQLLNYQLHVLDACCWRKVLVPWVPSFAFAHNSVNELPRHQSKPRVSCRGDVFWRVAFNSIVAFHRGIIHLLPKSKKEYLLCQRATTTLFKANSTLYFTS